jgi:pimeloyl-ACP methyl ester carboxylesterase
VVLFGHSSGAQSALQTALLVPERIGGVVLAGPTLDPAARNGISLMLRIIATVRAEVPAEWPAVRHSYAASGLLPLARLIRSAVHDHPEEGMAELSVPVAVMTGRHDRLAPPLWADHLAHLASAPCVILSGAHNTVFPFSVEAAHALHDRVERFVRP